MLIQGLQRLTLLDFPGKIACTVFTGGCNMRCPYCHNGSLALGQGEMNISAEELLAFLGSRVGRLDGVCISGGEPTLHRDLPELIREIKALGFKVKLDTNGTNPEMLLSLINDGLLDYVAMDVKNSPEKYALTAGLNSELTSPHRRADTEGDGELSDPSNTQKKDDLLAKIRLSAKILMENRVDFEFRTTLMRELHSEGDLEAIGRWLSGEEKYFLQTYRDEGDLLVGGFTAYTPEETQRLLDILREYIPNAEIR